MAKGRERSQETNSDTIEATVVAQISKALLNRADDLLSSFKKG